MSLNNRFFGRNNELAELTAELRNPRGAAILVIGQQGMGKTALLEHLIEHIGEVCDLQCGAVRQEVTQSDTVETVLSMLVDRMYEAALFREGSLDPTAHRLAQWRALLNMLGVGDLVMSLRRDPRRSMRVQFLEAMDRISSRMPENGRAVFVIEPEKYLAGDSDQDWAILIRRIPARIKLVFSQRPEDQLADSDLIRQLESVVCIPADGLDVLDNHGYEDFLKARSREIGITLEDARRILAPYHHHPYAIAAAMDMLRAGVKPESLPSDPKPISFAAAQWKRICRGGISETNGDLAIRLFQAYALLEVPSPDEVVEAVSGLSSTERAALKADRFLGPLIRHDGDTGQIYHVILSDFIRQHIPASQAHIYHERATTIFRQRIESNPPEALAAKRLARHVRAIEGESAFVRCLIQECAVPLDHLGLITELETLTVEAIKSVVPNSREHAQLLVGLSTPMQTRGDLSGAESKCRESLEIYERLGLMDERGVVYGNLGNVMLAREDLNSAEKYFRKALAIYEKHGRLKGMASSYGNLGVIMQIRGDLDKAEEQFRRSLEINETLQRLEGVATDLGNLGNIMLIRRDLDNAEEQYRRSLEINERLGRLEDTAINYGNIGNIRYIRGDLDGAESLFRQALEINERLGRPEGVIQIHCLLGRIMLTRGDLLGAEAMYRKAFQINDRFGWLDGMTDAYAGVGDLMLSRGELDEAERMYHKAVEVSEKFGRLEGMTSVYVNLGKVKMACGKLDEAESMYRNALDICEKFGRTEGIVNMYRYISRVRMARGDTAGANEMQKKAIGLMKSTTGETLDGCRAQRLDE